jgi:hypothetical protein
MKAASYAIGTLFESVIRVNLSSPVRLSKLLDTGIRKSFGNGRAVLSVCVLRAGRAEVRNLTRPRRKIRK